jgi:hypothetical protein
MPGRRTKNVTNPQAHDAWNRRKKEINQNDTTHWQFQKMWRQDCLKARAKAGKLTKKNFAECKALGLMGTQYEPLEA